MAAPEHAQQIVTLKGEFDRELKAIGNWWLEYSIDEANGGFYGEISAANVPNPDADKGVVLNSRLLWFFSSAALVMDDSRYAAAAERAYHYLRDHFVDQKHGGFYWSLTARRDVSDDKKQVYAQAFAIYALSAYYQLTRQEEVLKLALDGFSLVERYGVDPTNGGYFEAFARDWSTLNDVRLSDKDLNYRKTMNTHLHLLEAYTELYRIAPTSDIKAALAKVAGYFDRHIIDRTSGRLRMFMDDAWSDFSPGYTYGHDIEFSWLMSKALDVLDDRDLHQRTQPTILQLVDGCIREASGRHGELFDSRDFVSKTSSSERIWWVQAEALVGYLKAYTVFGEERFFAKAADVWSFIKGFHIDEDAGEWLWLSRLDPQPASPHYKAGLWKGPYHNGRAMIEATKILARLDCR